MLLGDRFPLVIPVGAAKCNAPAVLSSFRRIAVHARFSRSPGGGSDLGTSLKHPYSLVSPMKPILDHRCED